jgi:hypothetical protein
VTRQPHRYGLRIQFTTLKAVLEGMGCGDLHKSRKAIEELARNGIAVNEN